MKKRIAVIQPSLPVPYIYESALRNNVEFVVIMPPGEELVRHYDCFLAYEVLPLFDEPDRSLDLLEQLHARWKFDGIMCNKEQFVVWTALAAKRLGLKGIEPEAARSARDKATMRRLFRSRGLLTPKFIELSGMAEIERCREMKFPFVVKPTSGVNSDGVQLVANWTELCDAIKHVEHLNADVYRRVSFHGGENFSRVLVEEYLPGHEYCVELFSLDGDVRALSCGYKGHPTGPHFEETVYLAPPPLPKEKIAEIQATAVEGMLALGLVNGPGHCELRLNEDGKPVILEIGARIGGSGCAHFNVQGSTGIDFANLQFSYLVGEAPEKFWPPRAVQTSRAASMWIVPMGGHGTLKGIDGLEEVKQHPDCERILMFAKFGKVYRPYPKFDGFLAMVFAEHESTQAGEAFFEFCEKTIKVNWEN